jgi:type I restriction enzyme S subunit
MYQLETPFVQRHFIKNARGTAQKGVYLKTLGQTPIRVAPFQQQKRIVAEIEKQLSRLDKAVANLQRVKTNLKRYKAAVLKAAIEGKLTEEWRNQNPDIEPASKLLKRILAERRTKWEEAELAKMKGQGKAPKNKQWKSKYKEHVQPDTETCPQLPYGWTWATVAQLASDEPRSIQSGPFGSNLKHMEFQNKGRLVVGIDNVQDGFFSLGSENRISEEKFKELEKYIARPGDVLITVMATVGRTCMIPEGLEPAIITKHVYRITVDRKLVMPEYLHLALWGGAFVREQMFGQVIGQTRPGLNGGIIKKLMIPLPTIKEQNQILNQINEKISILERLTPEQDKLARRSVQLRQSILQKAFSGELVHAEPTDEPASMLLERIKKTTTHKTKKAPPLTATEAMPRSKALSKRSNDQKIYL